jgi:outer membrane protein assembly factor BamB
MNRKSLQSIRSFLPAVLILLFLCTVTAWAGGAGAAGWPQWRGPNRDGISAETDWDPEALAGGPKVLWQFEIGGGHSNVAIGGDRLYTMARNSDGECVLCLDAHTGEEIWRYKTGKSKLAQATPTLDGKYLYALSYDGILLCLKAKSGKLVWKRDLINDFEAPRPGYGFGASPAVEGDLVIINAKHTGIALNKANGDVVWEGKVKEAQSVNGYSTPVFVDRDGVSAVLIFSFPGLFAMDLATGEQLWFYEWTLYGSPNIADPVVFEGRVFISSSETDPRGAVLDISGDEPELVWETREMANHVCSCVYIGGYLYGVDGDYNSDIRKCTLRCIKAESGELMWEEKTGGASLCSADGKLIILTAKGTLHIAEADPTGYVEISSCELPTETGIPYWWTPPVLCGRKIYCRNYSGDLVCIDVSK